MRILIVLLFLSLSGYAQPETAPGELFGEDFRTWLQQNWFDDFENISKNSSKGYTLARLEMYNKLDQKDGNLYCLFSGLAQEVPANGYNSAGQALPFDCEHIVPQSFFNRLAPMKNDIHHLAPTFNRWNSSRGSFPFAEIEDAETEKWMYLGDAIECNGTAPCLPPANIDLYSEMLSTNSNGFFEPREDAKGNVARSIFYFFTMYPQYNIERLGDVNTFYQWHLDDPVNEADIQRNEDIASYQGNKNPYINKQDWVYKAFIADEPVAVVDGTANQNDVNSLLLYNSLGQPVLYLNNNINETLNISIFDIYGKLVAVEKTVAQQQVYNLKETGALNNTGIYFVSISQQSNNLPITQHIFFYSAW